MKRASICGVAALAILMAGSIVLAKGTTGPNTPTATKPAAKPATTAQLSKVDLLKENHKAEMADWQAVLTIAQGEKATKTVTKIKSIIEARTKAYEKELAELDKPAGTTEKPAAKPTTTTDKNAAKPPTK